MVAPKLRLGANQPQYQRWRWRSGLLVWAVMAAAAGAARLWAGLCWPANGSVSAHAAVVCEA